MAADAPGSASRVDEIMKYLSTDGVDELPDDIKWTYDDGWDPDRLEEELQNHPFFMTKFPEGDEPVPPLLDAFQQLKYSEDENTSHELALNHKQDGVFHFKIKKYRIAGMCFTTGINYEMKADNPDPGLFAQLYNNRSACMHFLGNYRSCVNDCVKALTYDPTYVKAIKRGIDAALIISDYQLLNKFFEYADDIQELDDVVTTARVRMKKQMASDKKKERAATHCTKMKDLENSKVLEMVRSRGIKLSNPEFTKSEAAESNGKVVRIGENSTLDWPVLFLYPQFNVTDFVEAFSEITTFRDQLTIVLVDRPSWDADGEYNIDTVEVFYTTSGRLVPVDLDSTLLSVMTRADYLLPSNGVPGFIVLCANGFCRAFKDNAQ